MFGATLQAAVTILVAASLATYVHLRAARTPMRTPLLALLAALIVWSCGVIWRGSAREIDSSFIGFAFGWMGVVAVPPLWALLAARYARVRALENHPRLALALLVPAALLWISVATSPWHELMYRNLTIAGPPERGPLWYVFLAYAYGMIGTGVVLYLRTPRRMVGRMLWENSLVFAIAALLPTVASVLYVLQVLPMAYDPTPGVFTLSLVVLTFGAFRYHLLDVLPLARGDAVDFLREAVLITDASGAVIDANRAATALLGRSPDEARGLRLAELLAPLGPDAEVVAELEATFDRLVPDAPAEPVDVVLRDQRHIEVDGRSLRAPGGGPLGRLVVLRDRTEERRHEMLLRQSQKLETVGRLVAGVAHEVNNPLAYVRANLSHLLGVTEDVAKQLAAEHSGTASKEMAELPQIVSECLDGIDRISRIVDDMSRFAHPPGDGFTAVDVSQVVRVALRIAAVQVDAQIRIETRLEPDLPAVHGSAARLEQVVLNLVLNAAQALAPRGSGSIQVVARRADQAIEIEVIDDGPGIDESQRERIFDPFFTTRDAESGTGLGLSIAHDILREHGGTLSLRSSSDAGACFVASLPL